MLAKTPKGNRIHIAILGKRNVGKSSFMNAFTGQDKSIVSSTPGTTTDPVEKAYELHPFGPVLLIDSAGIDDVGELGEKRTRRSREIMKSTDIACVLLEEDTFGDFDKQLISLLKNQDIPFILVINKIDSYDSDKINKFSDFLKKTYNTAVYQCSSITGKGIDNLKKSLASRLGRLTPPPPILADLVQSPDLAVLVIPIDKEAPKGRLILPQVQTIRELLDADVPCVCVKERELRYTLDRILKIKPKIVVTDSQAFLKVNADVPREIQMTSFSILFARQKGDLTEYIKGIKAVKTLSEGDNILIAELCSHRPISEDIGRVKIPRWLEQYTGLNLNYDFAAGKDFPADLSKYKLIIQCGGCMVNRQLILSRIREARQQNTPVTNYGILISFLHGILDRTIKPFPHANIIWEEIKNEEK